MGRQGFPGGIDGKESACNAGDPCSVPGSRRCLREGNGNPLQYSYLGNPMDRGAWWPIVHGVARVGHNLMTKPQVERCGNTHLYIHMTIGLYVYSFIHIHVHGCVSMFVCVYPYHLHEALKLHHRLGGNWSTKYLPFVSHALRSVICWKLCQRQQSVELRNRYFCSTKNILKMYLPKFYLTMRIHRTSYQDKILRKQWYRTTVIPQLCSRES